MDTGKKQKRNRLIALCFASVLLLLVYGPLANWFLAADRIVYDSLASGKPNAPLSNAYIVSIDAAKAEPTEVIELYGKIIGVARDSGAKRVILANPPSMDDLYELPSWTVKFDEDMPVFVPTRHPLAETAAYDGFVEIYSDNDDVLRQSSLWLLNGGIMSPSLPLAITLHDNDLQPSARVSSVDDAIYLYSYREVPRLAVVDILDQQFDKSQLQNATVFVDSEPELAGAAAMLPSGQFVTHSEVTAALLANLEQNRAIISPSWISAMQWLAPVLLSIIAVLFLPDRSRKNIAFATIAVAVSLLISELLLLYLLHVRIDMGRPIVIYAGIAILCAWLVEDRKKVTRDAFKRGSDFLAAGRLEPAFAEFRRCPPSDTLSTVMYKLSLAFEQQAKPERAEAVLEWMKRTQGANPDSGDPVQAINGMPRQLGRYVIQRRIGRGAMGAVYLAKDPRINRSVAVKAIPIEKEFEDEELKEARLRFFREAESAGRLTHPNIITVFDAGEDKGLAYIAMEYVPGIPLKKFTDKTKLLAPKRALELAAATAEALDYAHAQGVIHRDIKPANLLYNPKEGSLKISDFGVARLTDNNRTKTGIVLGTPMYMSPEQLNAEDLTGHSDLFSLGVTLYELLVGEVPFKASNIAVLMTKITTEDAAPLSTQRAGIPPVADTILAKAMAKRPEDRFTCGSEMAIALRNCARSA